MMTDFKEILSALYAKVEGVRAESPTAGTRFRLMGLAADIAEVVERLQREVLSSGVIEHLKSGYAVQMGALGKFSVGLSSDGADDAESFTSSMIRRVRVRYSSGKKAQAQLATAQFEQVATRELQAKSRKDMRTAVSNTVAAAGGDGGDDNGGGDVTGGDDQTE